MKNDNPIHMVVLDDAQIAGRVVISEPAFAQAIVIPASGQSGLTLSGTKCEHGVYIPANSPYPTLSDYCTCCWPYLLAVKPNGAYLATKKLESEDAGFEEELFDITGDNNVTNGRGQANS